MSLTLTATSTRNGSEYLTANVVIVPPKTIRPGVELLDERGPEGWREMVREHLHTLNVREPDKCILKAVYGRYMDGLEALGIGDGWAYGFNGFDSITRDWQNYIRATTPKPRV